MVTASTVAVSGRSAFSETELLAGYNKLISIRDEIFGKRTSATEQVNQSANLANARTTHIPPPAFGISSRQIPNGTAKSHAPPTTTPAQLSISTVTKTSSNVSQPKGPYAQKPPSHIPGSSGIDPIFLTKSTVLVRAEIHQKRQRLEKALEDQVHKLQRQKAIEQDVLPDFDPTEVLRKAHELVKPTKLLEASRPNGAASSNDSIDENTFYSSQMDESTTTEEADESRKWRPHRICRFFLQGEHCRYGETCTFSHDPLLKQKLETEASQPIDVDRSNADEQGSSRQEAAPNKGAHNHNVASQLVSNSGFDESSKSHSKAEIERQDRIARLEAELRSARAEQETHQGVSLSQQGKEKNKSNEEPTYSPPEPDEFGRNVDLRENRRHPAPNVVQRRPSTEIQPSERVHAKHNHDAPSSLPNNVRVVTNHIRSPVAPQPSRVSPLATAKAPQVAQIQREEVEHRRISRRSNAVDSNVGQSPKIASQPRNSKKRRRGRDSGEQMRNVVARTDLASPVIRVKEEPLSPPPFDIANADLRQVRLRQEPLNEVYVDSAPIQRHDGQQVHGSSKPAEIRSHDAANIDRDPRTPTVRRVISHNGQRYHPGEQSDLRRVVTAPRQARAPMSPVAYPAQYSAPQPRAARAPSQVYLSPTGQTAPYSSRGFVQNTNPTHGNYDRSPSAPLRPLAQPPIERHPTLMAPPPRRIVVDQWGNRFMEVPVPVERHTSVAPIARTSQFDTRYEPVLPRSTSVMRQSDFVRIEDDNQYIRQVPSPTSSILYEAPRRTTFEPRGTLYEDGSYEARNVSLPIAQSSDPNLRTIARYEEAPEPDARIIRMQSVRPAPNRNDVGQASDERIIRMQSVRPTGSVYEAPQQQMLRVQSARPEQPRIIKLGERQEPGRQVSRQVSVHPNDGESRQIDYAVGEQPRYQYTPVIHNRGYVEDIQEDGQLYNTSGIGERFVRV